MRTVDQILRGAKRLGMPLFSCSTSKHAFTQHQLLVLVVLRQRLARSYREFVDLLEVMTALRRRLRLRTLPHFTTLHKFSLRLDESTLDVLVATLASSTASDGVLAVDSTGFSTTLRGEWMRDKWHKHRRFVKAHVAVNMEALDVLVVVVTDDSVHDSEVLVSLVEQVLGRSVTIKRVLADGAYDTRKC